MHPKKNLDYYPSLDGLRGVAVLIVVLHHGIPGGWVTYGGAGVDVFFTLSGFLITSILLRELDNYGSVRVGSFYARRFLRLMPCLWLVVCSVGLYWWITWPVPWVRPFSEVLAAIFYVTNITKVFGNDGSGYVGHTWSLAAEEQFYLVWPVAVVILHKIRLSRVVQGAIVLSVAVGVVTYRAAYSGVYSPSRVYYGPDTHCDGLLMGAAISYILPHAGSVKLSAVWSRLLGRFIAPAAMSGIGVASILFWSEGRMIHFGITACNVCAAIVIIDLIAGADSVLDSLFRVYPLVLTGKISYGLYLWHVPIFAALKRSGVIRGSAWHWDFLAGTALSFAVAAASYYLIERRFLDLKQHFQRTAAEYHNAA